MSASTPATAIDIAASLWSAALSVIGGVSIFLASLILVYRWKSSLAPIALIPLSALAGWLLFR